jgi:hypothetical protein
MKKAHKKRLENKEQPRRAVPVSKKLKRVESDVVAEELEIFIHEDDWDDIVVRHKNRSTTYMSVKGFSRELEVPRNIVEKIIDKNHLPVRRTMKIRGETKSFYRLKEFFAAYLTTEGARQTRDGAGRPKKERPATKEDADLRFSVARADKAELDLALTAGVVHLEDDITRNVGDMLQAFRARVLSIPAKAATAVPPEFRSDVEAAVKKITNEALTEIASYRAQPDAGEARLAS